VFTTTVAGRPCHFDLRITARLYRTLTIAGFICVAALATAAPALAQMPTISKSNDKDNNFATTRQSNCPTPGGELIAIQGKEMTHFEMQDTPGMFHYKISDHQEGTGTSATAQYQFQEWSDNSGQSSTNTMSTLMVFRHHLIRQGTSTPADDEFEDIVVEFKFVHGVPIATPKDINSEVCR
jgi:hypothetical protein